MLVEFEKKNVSLIKLSQLNSEFSEELNIEVDIVHGPLTDKSLLDIKKVYKYMNNRDYRILIKIIDKIVLMKEMRMLLLLLK